MRTHIAKSLQRRCKAIKNALRVYNQAAITLTPPRQQLDWSKVSHYTFLEEFNLLRDTRQDIQEKRWSDLAVRETMKQHQKIKRAQEEIHRCNVEVRRLHTAITHELQCFRELLPKLQEEDPLIYGAVHDYVSYRRQVNTQLLSKITQIHALKGFTGNPTTGVRKGSSILQDPQELIIDQPFRPDGEEGEDHDGDENDDDADSVTENIASLVDYLAELSIEK